MRDISKRGNYIKDSQDKMFYKVGLYIRLSREDGDKAESDSIGNQRLLLDQYIKDKKEFQLIDTYVDDGWSGTNFKRPDFRRMLTDMEDKKINCVIVKDLSRFGRDYIDTGWYIERYFPEKEIRFIAVNDNVDTLQRDHDMLMPIRNIFNQQYAVDISKKVSTAFRTKQEEGQFIGSFASYGYKKDPQNKHKLLIDEYAAGVVRRVFELFIHGKAKQQIAYILNQEGILSPSAYKIQNGSNYVNGRAINRVYAWSYTAIHEMLQKEMYIGNMVQHTSSSNGIRTKQKKVPKNQYIIIKNTHEPIIDMETWENTQKLLKKDIWKAHSDKNKVHLFAGFIKCGDCGKSMVKVARKQGGFSYCCASYRRYGKNVCTKHTIRSEVLKEIILEDLNLYISSMENLRGLVEEQKEIKKNSRLQGNLKGEIERLDLERLKTNKIEKDLYFDYKQGIITKTEYVTYKKDCKQIISEIEKRMETLCECEKNENLYTDPWIAYLLRHKSIETLDRNTLVEFVDVIHIYENNEVKITYNFSDKCRKRLRSEVEF